MDTQTPEQIAAKAEAAMVKRKEKIAKDYPHALVDTLAFDGAAGNGGKFKVQITCATCGDTERWVYTSDLHQVRNCVKCSDALKKAAKDAKKAEIKAAAALIKERSTVQA